MIANRPLPAISGQQRVPKLAAKLATVTRRDWWLGVAAVCATVAIAALPLAGQVLNDPGAITCAEWTKARASDGSFRPVFTDAVSAWAQGYLTGALDLSLSVAGDVPAERQAALTRGNTTVEHLTDADHIPRGIDAYCAQQHDATIGSMFLGLMRQAYGW